MTAFLMTWKKGKWPYSEILRMVDEFGREGSVSEPWRIFAHRQSNPSARVWLLKQGAGEKGIFGVGKIVGKPYKKSKDPGKTNTYVNVEFSHFTDPLKGLLIGESAIRQIIPQSKIATQASGVTLTDEQSAQLEGLLKPFPENKFPIDSNLADGEPFDPENIKDAREKIQRAIAVRRGQQSFRNALLQAYQRRCAITGCAVLDVLEAAHIFPYLGPETNEISNGLLLRSDIHTLFDCGLLSIHPSQLIVILASSLRDSTYEKLRGRKLRAPSNSSAKPSQKALLKRSEALGLHFTPF